MSSVLKSSSAVRIDPSSYVDPNGYVFWQNGQAYRAIADHVADFYERLIDDGYLAKLTSEFGLVGTQKSRRTWKQVPSRLVLEHEVIEPQTFCVEWPPSMLRAAGLATIDLALELAEHDLTLQDAYPWNVLFDGTSPVFVDVTSIVPVDDRWIWAAYGQFQSFFLYPLILSRMGKSRVARMYLMDNICGISVRDLVQNATTVFTLTHPNVMLTARLDKLLQENANLRRKLKRISGDLKVRHGRSVRRRFLGRLWKRVDALSFSRPGDAWASYYDSIPEGVDKTAKRDAVEHWLRKLKPKTVLDLGANTGPFSILAATQGSRVVALDGSEDCMESLYHEAKAKDLSITPLVTDVLSPTPAYGFMSRQYAPLMDRVKSDLVMCLGLMHHLHIAGRQSFERISEMLAHLATKHLIFEFVGMEDENNELIASPREVDYSLDSVKAALARHFKIEKTLDSDRGTRRLLICTRKND